jgi:type III pantothenate kinase
MQLDALHEHTAALPEIEFKLPHDDTFGRSTAEAMLHGVYHGIRGMVWKLTENYAAKYGAYPIVIATGGNAQMLFGDDELIDRVVPELTLLGIAAAAKHALATDAEAE